MDGKDRTPRGGPQLCQCDIFGEGCCTDEAAAGDTLCTFFREHRAVTDPA
jgi:hypothetical protein